MNKSLQYTSYIVYFIEPANKKEKLRMKEADKMKEEFLGKINGDNRLVVYWDGKLKEKLAGMGKVDFLLA
jgi:hypothetical protein